jgi:VCBS repeat-containing protein
VILPGDILTTEQLSQMTFAPLRTQEDQSAQVCYLPIYSDRVETSAAMTISIRGKQDNAPVAEDFSIETYKNLPNQGKLKVSDPEGQTLTFSLLRKPRRGEVTISEDGTFVYTPKKNKVGVDSFTFSAADPAGNVSREATVTIQILKPSDSKQYTDTVGMDCRFAAEWMRNNGLFEGEKLGKTQCFYPDKTVTRGEFLSMVINALDIPTKDVSMAGVPADTPQWLKPYLAAAQRSGLAANLPLGENGSFQADAPITGAEAAVILQNALDLTISQETLETLAMTAATEDAVSDVPAWAQVSLTAMADNGIQLEASTSLTRGDVAQLLYQVSYLAIDAPGITVIRMQK